MGEVAHRRRPRSVDLCGAYLAFQNARQRRHPVSFPIRLCPLPISGLAGILLRATFSCETH